MKKSNQMIRCDSYYCGIGRNDDRVLVLKVRAKIMDKKAVFEVPIDHIAILIHLNGEMKVYSCGIYPVFENDEEVEQWMKNGVAPQIFYIAKNERSVVPWGISDLSYRDKKYGRMLTLGVSGDFSVEITDVCYFFKKFGSINTDYTIDDFIDKFSDYISNFVADILINEINRLELGYDDLNLKKNHFALEVQKQLSPMFFEQWGINIYDFKINALICKGSELIEDDLDVQREVNRMGDKRYLNYLSRIDKLSDKQWEKEKYLIDVEAKYKLKQLEQDALNSERGKSHTADGVKVYDQNINGVLDIICRSNGVCSAGSGYLITEDGLAITNAHVVFNDKESKIFDNVTAIIASESVAIDVLAVADNMGGKGKGVDLALLKLRSMPPKAKPLTFVSDFESVKTGEEVFVIGNSKGDGACITSGIVSDRLRKLNGKLYLMTDCPINGGNSGGPIMNKNGEVIGTIVASRLNADGSGTEGMNYAIPLPLVIDFIKKCIK